MKEIRVKCFTQGSTIASTRFRLSQLTDHLAKRGINLIFSHAYESAYPPYGIFKRILWFILEVATRFFSVFFGRKEAINIFQREMISTFHTFEGAVQGKTILDVDDAVWLHKKGRAIDKIAKNADHIVCGNLYIADYFRKFNLPITVIPTVVDTSRFVGCEQKQSVIGWTGGSGAFSCLYDIEEQLAGVLSRHSTWRLRIVADMKPSFKIIPDSKVEYIKWNPDIEVESINTMSIGLMPLTNDNWSLGKCSYKMLLYMACKLPVIASNIGMNKEILEQSRVGIGIKSKMEWEAAIEHLIVDRNLREDMGIKGRMLVSEKYCLNVAAKKWTNVINIVDSL
ncbi:glycosyltransferase family 4 protein [Gammaproteobacteria bacterium]|nr:glycosyltransferase family 4 protein [Gammaproteobacteria bacterium]